MLLKLYKLSLSKDREFNRKLFWTFGIIPRKTALYKEAFTHNSLKERHKHEDKPISNERLEYLGDAVLDLVVAEKLFSKYPFKDEGFLTEMRSKVVSRNQLAVLGKKIGIQPFINRSNQIKLTPQSASVMVGNALEAFIGAVYLDKGYKDCKKYIESRVLERFINFEELEETEISYKSRLHKWSQKTKKEIQFDFDLAEPGSEKSHSVNLSIDGEVVAKAKNYSKKKAMEQACKIICEKMDI